MTRVLKVVGTVGAIIIVPPWLLLGAARFYEVVFTLEPISRFVLAIVSAGISLFLLLIWGHSGG